QRRGKCVPIAVLNPAIKVHLLDDDTEVLCPPGFPRLGTNLIRHLGGDVARGAVGVLNVEDGLVRLDEGSKGLALGVLDALLVHREVDNIDDVGNDVSSILKTNGHLVRLGLFREEAHKVDGVIGSESEAIVILLWERKSVSVFETGVLPQIPVVLK